jgi:hypothetical protein
MLASMQSGVPITERAFQLARSGTVSTVADVKRTLHREGYDANALQGRNLFRQLHAVIRAERQRARPPTISDEAAVPEMPEGVAKDYDGSPM